MIVGNIFIAGSGAMGSGIAQVCAQAGNIVYIYDIDEKALKKAWDTISWSVGKLSEKGVISESIETVMGRIRLVTNLSVAESAQLIIEAVSEDINIKLGFFSELNKVISPEAIVATNTSAIPISELAVNISNPGRFLGLHFFNPVPMMKAVEVIRGILTSEDIVKWGCEFVRSIEKEPVLVNRDVAGFVINRINYPAIIEAMRLVEEGIATCEDMDKGLRLASGRKMGIFETSDMVGLEVTYGGLMAMYKETGEERWFPPMILRRKVKAGQLGRKAGKGWYEYHSDGKRKSEKEG